MNSQSDGGMLSDTRICKFREIEIGNLQDRSLGDIYPANISLPYLSSEPDEKPEKRLSK